VNAHLERDAVRGTDGQSRVHQQWEVDRVLRETGILQQRLRRPRLVWINRDDLGINFAEFLERLTQLRELVVADRSRVAIDEDQNDRLFAAEIAQPNPLPGDCFQLEVRRRLSDSR
jgi:hypothetical protein